MLDDPRQQRRLASAGAPGQDDEPLARQDSVGKPGQRLPVLRSQVQEIRIGCQIERGLLYSKKVVVHNYSRSRTEYRPAAAFARTSEIAVALASSFLRWNQPRGFDFAGPGASVTSIYGRRARTGVPGGNSHSPRKTFCRNSATNPSISASTSAATDPPA